MPVSGMRARLEEPLSLMVLWVSIERMPSSHMLIVPSPPMPWVDTLSWCMSKSSYRSDLSTGVSKPKWPPILSTFSIGFVGEKGAWALCYWCRVGGILELEKKNGAPLSIKWWCLVGGEMFSLSTVNSCLWSSYKMRLSAAFSTKLPRLIGMIWVANA